MLARLFRSLWNIHRSAAAPQCCNESDCKDFWILPLRSHFDGNHKNLAVNLQPTLYRLKFIYIIYV